MKTSRALAAALFVTCLARSASAAPEDPGSFGTQTLTFDVPVSGGLTLSTEVHLSQAPGARPLVVLRHGYTSYKENMVGWAEHLATRGFVGVSFTSRDPNTIDSATDGADMAAVTTWLLQRAADNASPLFGRIDTTRVAVGGHSAGGAAATVAAKQIAPQALVLIDTMDSPEAIAAAKDVTAPTVATFAPANGCNENGDNQTTFKTVAGPRFGVFVSDSSHCDGEDPIDVQGCGSFCGAPTVAHHASFLRYTTAFLEAYLLCDASAYPYVNGATAKGDGAVTILAETAKIQLPTAACAGPSGTDGGTGSGDSGASSSSSSSSSSSGGSSSGASPGEPAPASGSGGDGGGCAVPSERPSASWLLLFAFAPLAAALLRRRRS